MGILEVIAAITNLITEVIKSQPPDVSAELWKLHLKDVQAFRAFFENMLPKTPTQRLTDAWYTTEAIKQKYEDAIAVAIKPKKRKKGKKR